MEINLTQIGQRLREYLSFKKIKMSEFGRTTQISGAQISNIIHGKNFSLEKLINIANAYPDLNLLWLLKGQGKMINLQSQNTPATNEEYQDVQEIQTIIRKNKLLLDDIEVLRQKNITLENMITYQGLTIDAYKNSIEVLTSTNKDLKDIVQYYKGGTGNDHNNLRTA